MQKNKNKIWTSNYSSHDRQKVTQDDLYVKYKTIILLGKKIGENLQD